MCWCLNKNVSSSLCTARKKTKKTFLARVVTFASARGAPFSRAEEARTWTGEWCDHTRGTRTAHARACIKKRALVSNSYFVLERNRSKDDASTATTNVQPSRTRNDEENRFLLPRDGKDGERSSSERSR